jgi:hypothetical protein
MGLYPGRFVFQRTFGNKHQLCTVTMNGGTGQKGVPYITKYELEPLALPQSGGEGAIARAWVSLTSGELKGDVRGAAIQGGLMDKTFYFPVMQDKGNKDVGDVAGDQIFSGRLNPPSKTVAGERTVRYDAEAEDENGMRHGYAIEFGPVAVRKIDKTASLTPKGTDVAAPRPLEDGTGDSPSGGDGPGRPNGDSGQPDGERGNNTIPPPRGPFDRDIIITSPGLPPNLPPDVASGTILQANKVRVKQGDTVRVRVLLWNASNISGMNFTVKYDESVASPDGQPIKGSLLSNVRLEANPSDSSGVLIGFADETGISGTGSIVYVPFKAVGKPGDRTPINLNITTVNKPDGSVPSVYEVAGEILIVDDNGFQPGDSDGNGEINELDALDALKMSVKLIPIQWQTDIDKNGEVTSRDATLIMQMVRQRG